MSDFTVVVDGERLPAEWTETAPETREAVEAALPVGGEAARWGAELYVRTDIDVGPENARAEVSRGAVAYWPQGDAVCLFWGPTPASTGPEPRAASPVNVFARADVSGFSPGAGGATLRLERA